MGCCQSTNKKAGSKHEVAFGGCSCELTAHLSRINSVDSTYMKQCMEFLAGEGVTTLDDLRVVEFDDINASLTRSQHPAIVKATIRKLFKEGQAAAAPEQQRPNQQRPATSAPASALQESRKRPNFKDLTVQTSGFGGPTVVVIGECGVGKSTILEKVTGVQGYSSTSDTSFTRTAQAVIAKEKDIQLIDTPGNNSLLDNVGQLVQIAHAFSYAPVSTILIVVKADQRIDNVIDAISRTSADFPMFQDLIAICVTWKDIVTWDDETFQGHLKQTGINRCVFFGKTTPGPEMKRQIRSLCVRPRKIGVDSENFWKFFHLKDANRGILGVVQNEVTDYNTAIEEFKQYLETEAKCFIDAEKADLVFEFHKYMEDFIPAAQSRLCVACNFPAELTEVQLGHCANMANRMRHRLLEVRIMMMAYQPDNSMNNQFRKCPSCGLIWAKFVGCDGRTTCGEAHAVTEVDGGGRNSRASFSFVVTGGHLKITKNPGVVQVTHAGRRPAGARHAGCGASIIWSEMKPVNVDEQLPDLGINLGQFLTQCNEKHNPTVEDVAVIQAEQAQHWNDILGKKFKKLEPMKVQDLSVPSRRAWF